jgi:hypothetical protein
MARVKNPRWHFTIGASLSVEHLSHHRFGRLLPIPDLACRPLAMSAVRRLTVSRRSQTSEITPVAQAAVFLREAPLNIARLTLLSSCESDDIARVARALADSGCHGFLVSLQCWDLGDNVESLRALIPAANGMRWLRVLETRGSGPATTSGMPLLDAAAATLRRLHVICPADAVLNLSRCPRLLDLALSDCDDLTTVQLPPSLRWLRDRAFSHAKKLTEVALPAALEKIGRRAFFNCELLSVMDLSHTRVSSVGDFSWNSCTALRALQLPATLQRLGHGAFRRCCALASLDLSRTALTVLDDKCLFECTALARLLLPPCLATIGAEVLQGCGALPELDLSHTVVAHVGDDFLVDGAALTSMKMPAALQTIGTRAFSGACNLVSLDLSHTALSFAGDLRDNVPFATFPIVCNVTKKRERQ